MFKFALAVLFALTACVSARAQDEFRGITCTSDVAKTLIGRKIADATVVSTEKRHTDIHLKDIGASEGDTLSDITWSLCGTRYDLLFATKSSIILDVINIPGASHQHPMFEGPCQRDHIALGDEFIGVLDNTQGAQPDPGTKVMLPAITVWKLDERQKKYVPTDAKGVTCSAEGLFTADTA